MKRSFRRSTTSIFKETGLKEYLDKQGIEKLVLCGMQTEYCVDTSVKVGFEYGYKLGLFQKELSQPLMGKDIPAETINEFYEGHLGGNVLQMS